MKKDELLIQQVKNFLTDDYVIANLSNITALVFDYYEHINWVGYYFYIDNQLVLGPFQGKVACTPLSLNKGVCAHCFNTREVTVVNDVSTFKGHIACDSESRSEFVAPLIKKNQYLGVLDIDSNILNYFDEQKVATLLTISQLINDYLANQTALYPSDPMNPSRDS